MKLKAGSAEHLALSAALCVLTGKECREVLERAFDCLSTQQADQFSKELIQTKVLPVVARAREVAGACLPEAVTKCMDATTRAAAVVLELYEREIADFAKTMRCLAGSVIMLKGVDLAANVWPRIPRVMADLDLLVQAAQLEEAKSVLAQLGYMQGRLDRSRCVLTPFTRTDFLGSDKAHYEIPIFRKIVRTPELDDLGKFLTEQWRNNFFHIGSAAYLLLEVDVHHNILKQFSAVRLWERPRVVYRHGQEVFALSPENLLLMLAFRCYLESVTIKFNVHPVHLFLDILAVVVRFSPEIDWDDVERQAAKHGLLAPVYYVVRHANDFLGGDRIPASYLTRWHPRRRGNDRAWDYGDFVPRLFDHLEYFPLELV